MIKYSEILKLDGERYNFNTEKNYRGVCIDSRIIKKNEIFFAIKGEMFDGHSFIESLIRKGIAGAYAVNKKWFLKNKEKYKKEKFIIVNDTIKALGELAKIHKEEMAIPIFFLGGSNGKTSTKDMMGTLLNKKFNLVMTDGNFNNHIGLPLSILKIDDNHNFCLLEAGSNHFGELKYLCDIGEPDYGLITNIGKEHLEFFENIEGAAKEEFEIYDYVNQKGIRNFYNLDDKLIKKYYNTNTNKAFTYSYSEKADLQAEMNGFDKNYRPVVSYKWKNKKYTTSINIFGMSGYYNGLASIAAGLYFGIEPEVINKVLSEYVSPRNKRMQLTNENGIILINDAYNSNPDSVKMGLNSISGYKITGRKHILMSDMLEMGSTALKEHQEIGKYIKKSNIDYLYTYGENSYEIFKGAKGLKNNFYFDEKPEMAEFIRLNLKKGDMLYVKGSRGMKLEEVVKLIFKN